MLTAGSFCGTIGNMAPYFASYMKQVTCTNIKTTCTNIKTTMKVMQNILRPRRRFGFTQLHVILAFIYCKNH